MSVFTNPNDAHFWVFIALIVFGVVLWRANVHSMAGKALDAAGLRVQAQLDEAARLRAEAQALLADIQTRREATERLGAQLLEQAHRDAERARIEAEAALTEDIRRRGALAERKIALAESQATAEIKAAAAELAAQAAEGILASRLTAAKSDPLIDAGLAGLKGRFS